MFSKQHFESIANLIKTSEINQKEVLASEFVKLFSLDNAKFSTAKFLKACANRDNENVFSVPKFANLRIIPQACCM